MLIEADWLPPILTLASCDGDAGKYLDTVYQRYMKDLGGRRLLFKARPIALRFHPESHGKGYGFWHCVQEGAIEADRIPDMERCKRIPWIKAIIENYGAPGIDYWQEVRYGITDHLLWWQESYLIVLSERGQHPSGAPDAYLLKTAYLIEREHQRRKRRQSRDAWRQAVKN